MGGDCDPSHGAPLWPEGAVGWWWCLRWLSSNQLSGSLPASLGQLTALRYLYPSLPRPMGGDCDPSHGASVWPEGGLRNINTNQLSGSLSSCVGQLTALQSLYLLVKSAIV